MISFQSRYEPNVALKSLNSNTTNGAFQGSSNTGHGQDGE